MLLRGLLSALALLLLASMVELSRLAARSPVAPPSPVAVEPFDPMGLDVPVTPEVAGDTPAASPALTW